MGKRAHPTLPLTATTDTIRTVTISSRNRRRKIEHVVPVNPVEAAPRPPVVETDFLNLDPNIPQSSDGPEFPYSDDGDVLDLWQDLDAFEDMVNPGGEEDEREVETIVHQVEKPQRATALEEFIPRRRQYLDRFMETDAFGPYADVCVFCSDGSERIADIRCIDCSGLHPCCRYCALSAHSLSPNLNPYHRLERWNGSFWHKYSLYELGLTYTLGHGGRSCAVIQTTISMTILHTNGFHNVSVNYCGCAREPDDLDNVNQLLRSRLFPSTHHTPRTAFTFAALDLLTQSQVRGKTSVEHFYQTMRSLTDNMNLENWPKRLDELLHCIRWYRHLHLLKRGGLGHTSGELWALAGQLALLCPACPNPGRNLPNNWTEEQRRHLITTFLALDANMRLKQKERGFDRDQYLGPGWAYCVDPVEFKAELDRVAANPPKVYPSTCDSTHSAIEKANSAATEGYAVTGVGGVVCSRHGVIMPGVTDLQIGERQINMDFSFLWTVRFLTTTPRKRFDDLVSLFQRLFKLTYDIACQWARYFSERVEGFPPSLQDAFRAIKLEVGIPKYHLPAHGVKCRNTFSLNFLTGWGRTDGEGIERNWSSLNGFATATREMGPGARHDFLDFQMGAISFRKICDLGTAMLKKLKDATAAIPMHQAAYDDLCEAAPEGKVTEWLGLVDRWQKDHTVKPNPYQESWDLTTGTLADLRKELAQQEARMATSASDIEHSTSASAFILQGLEYEEVQRSMIKAAKSSDKLSRSQSAALEEKKTTYKRRILTWTSVQAVYMPFTPHLRLTLASAQPAPSAPLPPVPESSSNPIPVDYDLDNHWDHDSDDDEDDGSEAFIKIPVPGLDKGIEHFDLLLPSALDAMQRRACNPALASVEARARLAILETCIRDLRRLLTIKSNVLSSKKNLFGQREGTRAHGVISNYNSRIDDVADRYRSTRERLLRLDTGEWKERLRALKKEDVRAATQDPEPEELEKRRKKAEKSKKRGLGEGQKELSWIWKIRPNTIPGQAEPDPDAETLTIWAKAHARVGRWKEEHELVVEEMRRIPWDLECNAVEWDGRVDSRKDGTELVQAGCRAYALKQAHNWRSLARRFMTMWVGPLKEQGISHQWPGEPSLGEESCNTT